MHDDKLVSCERLRCGMSRRSTRKRGRLVADVEGDEDECDEQSLTSSHPSTNTSLQSSNSRKKARTHAHPPKSKPDSGHEASNQMDIDDAPTLSSSPNPRPRASKPNPNPQRYPSPKQAAHSSLRLLLPHGLRPPITHDSASASVSPERGRDRKGPSVSVAKANRRGIGIKKGKASVKALEVDSSVDAERMDEQYARVFPTFSFLYLCFSSGILSKLTLSSTTISDLISLFERTEREVLGGAGASNVLKHYRGFQLSSGPRTQAYFARLFAHPVFKATCSTEELYIDNDERYAFNGPNTSQVAHAIISGRSLP
ncbi:hypothetical protein E4T56_gene5584 [Termitomyces sp. T112]|nr:hypothetical protein E4T56_gene5584 [Termitomyces sp. T112]